MIVLEVLYVMIFKIHSIFLRCFPSGIILNGNEKFSNEPMKIIFIGFDEKSISYLAKILFFKKPKRKKIEKTVLWNLKRKIDKYSKKIDGVIIKTDCFYNNFLQKQGFFVIPEWINMSLDTSDSLQKIKSKFKKSTKKKIRKISKYGYSYEITEDPNKLKYFYYKMYLPYTIHRYGQSAIINDFYKIRYHFEKGKLMFVKDGNKYICGSILSNQKKHIVRSLFSGFLREEYDYLNRDVGTADYYFSILWAKKTDKKILDFGITRAFLNDGVLQYKRNWNMNMTKSETLFSNIWGFKVLKNSNAIKNFLIHNPFVCLDIKQAFKSVIFIPKNYNLKSSEIKKFKEMYHINGIEELVFIDIKNISNEKIN